MSRSPMTWSYDEPKKKMVSQFSCTISWYNFPFDRTSIWFTTSREAAHAVTPQVGEKSVGCIHYSWPFNRENDGKMMINP